MRTQLLSKELVLKLKKEVRNNIVFCILSSLLYIISLVLICVFMNRSNYKILSLIIALLTALLIGVLLFLIRINILQKKYYINIINRCLINDLDKKIGVFTKKDKALSVYHNLYVNKYIFRSNNKDYDLYINIDTPLNIEFEKQYEIEELNEYLVSFKDVEDEEKI